MRHGKGFTLLEVLVALSIAAIALTMALGGLQSTLRAWQGAARDAERLEQDQVLQRWLPAQLALARPLPLEPGATVRRRAVFEGHADRMRFVAPVSTPFGPPGLRVIELSARNVGLDKTHLYLAYPLWGQPDSASTAAAAEASERTLTDEPVGGVRFAYFGRPSPGAPAAWHPEWQDLPFLPRAVRIEFLPRPSQPGAELALIVPLHADGGLQPAWAEGGG